MQKAIELIKQQILYDAFQTYKGLLKIHHTKEQAYTLILQILNQEFHLEFTRGQIRGHFQRMEREEINKSPLALKVLEKLSNYEGAQKALQSTGQISETSQQIICHPESPILSLKTQLIDSIQMCFQSQTNIAQKLEDLKSFTSDFLTRFDSFEDGITLRFKCDPTHYTILYIFFQNIINNWVSNPGNRYHDIVPDNIIFDEMTLSQMIDPSIDITKTMFAVLSFCPPYWCKIIQSMFALPNTKTLLRCRRELQKRQHLTLNEVLQYNTKDPEFLTNYIETLWNVSLDNMADNRVVLAIDAAALKVNYGFNRETKETFGLIDNRELTPGEIQRYSNNFELFLKENPDIAKYVFVLLICPLDVNLSPIVLTRRFSDSGSATKDDLKFLLQCKDLLNHIGLGVMGCASDGDKQYQHFSTDFADMICGKRKRRIRVAILFHDYLEKPLHQFSKIIPCERWFQDVLHLLKCHRYHLIKGKDIQVLANDPTLTVSFEELKRCYPGNSELLFKDTLATKMDDRLAFNFFDWENVINAITKNPLLGPILLPSALLLQVFFNKKLTKDDRYHMLNMGTAIIYVQRVLLNTYKGKRSKKGPILPYNKDYMDKYLLLACSLASLFNDERGFDLADCSSHLLEHLFGMIRRFCSGNDSQERFDQSIEKAYCLRKWLSDLKISCQISGRIHQDKAATVLNGELSERMKNRSFLHYIIWAIFFIQDSTEKIIINKSPVLHHIIDAQYPSEYFDLQNDLELPKEKANTSTSANQTGIINVRGFLNLHRYKTQQQVDSLKQNETTESITEQIENEQKESEQKENEEEIEEVVEIEEEEEFEEEEENCETRCNFEEEEICETRCNFGEEEICEIRSNFEEEEEIVEHEEGVEERYEEELFFESEADTEPLMYLSYQVEKYSQFVCSL